MLASLSWMCMRSIEWLILKTFSFFWSFFVQVVSLLPQSWSHDPASSIKSIQGLKRFLVQFAETCYQASLGYSGQNAKDTRWEREREKIRFTNCYKMVEWIEMVFSWACYDWLSSVSAGLTSHGFWRCSSVSTPTRRPFPWQPSTNSPSTASDGRKTFWNLQKISGFFLFLLLKALLSFY